MNESDISPSQKQDCERAEGEPSNIWLEWSLPWPKQVNLATRTNSTHQEVGQSDDARCC
jgi:hypothetical protein